MTFAHKYTEADIPVESCMVDLVVDTAIRELYLAFQYPLAEEGKGQYRGLIRALFFILPGHDISDIQDAIDISIRTCQTFANVR